MTDFEVPKEVRDACEIAEHDLVVQELETTLHKAAILLKKAGINYMSLLQDGLIFKIDYRQDGKHKVFGRIDWTTNQFKADTKPSAPVSTTDDSYIS